MSEQYVPGPWGFLMPAPVLTDEEIEVRWRDIEKSIRFLQYLTGELDVALRRATGRCPHAHRTRLGRHVYSLHDYYCLDCKQDFREGAV